MPFQCVQEKVLECECDFAAHDEFHACQESVSVNLPAFPHREENDTNNGFYDKIGARLVVTAIDPHLPFCSTWNLDPAASTRLHRFMTSPRA